MTKGEWCFSSEVLADSIRKGPWPLWLGIMVTGSPLSETGCWTIWLFVWRSRALVMFCLRCSELLPVRVDNNELEEPMVCFHIKPPHMRSSYSRSKVKLFWFGIHGLNKYSCSSPNELPPPCQLDSKQAIIVEVSLVCLACLSQRARLCYPDNPH